VSIRQLDPALLRPGRLKGKREFRRLTRPEAQRLAEAKGLALADQADFSLAEIYCGAVGEPVPSADRQIGFGQ
jgi:ATP-dependent 26S proteasome regulatory subunit